MTEEKETWVKGGEQNQQPTGGQIIDTFISETKKYLIKWIICKIINWEFNKQLRTLSMHNLNLLNQESMFCNNAGDHN